ncbi:transmembrane protein 179B isoform X2 [Monodelphis domestica]|uniref:transmembrane protein 179B isoform X2 n=1 Tax=Monodelphis domestica TaxID=13616 RepID=UPI0004431D3B|nr:transmembrane protein 179B isoform X2 [Monodelphis domestica]
MALPGLHRAELVLFAAAFLAGAVVAAAVFRTQGSFNGQCPIYGTTTWNSSGLALSSSSAPSLCLFVAGVSGLLALYCLLLLLYWTYSSCLEDAHSCSEAQKLPWTPPGSGLHFYSILYDAEASAWVTLGLWCLVLALQLLQWKWEGPPFRPLERGDPEWSSETDALFGPRSPDPSLKSLR